jgi:molybdenum cofactor cytidylyltransferase
MISSLRKAFRLGPAPKLAVVGAGGKTTALFRLASEYSSAVIVTTTTHLGRVQSALADRHIELDDLQKLEQIEAEGWSDQTLLLTGPPTLDDERLQGLNPEMLERVLSLVVRSSIPLLIEADGSRRLPLKAPSDIEPAIPGFVDGVIVIAGLQGLGKPLDEQTVHRPEIFARLSGLQQGDAISTNALNRVLSHPQGGLKNIPTGARCMALLNGADNSVLQKEGRRLAERLLEKYDAAAIACLNSGGVEPPVEALVLAVYEPVAGIVLAAGGGERMGESAKLLLSWRGEPIVRAATRTALEAGLRPVVVVTGAHAEGIEAALSDLPVKLVNNLDWRAGQSSSIREGVQALPKRTGAVVFLLGDQPQTPAELVRALKDEYASSMAPIVAPVINGRRANPVLFDLTTFSDLRAMQGDAGGRQLFDRFGVHPLPWFDERQLWDVDTPADYERLMGMED